MARTTDSGFDDRAGDDSDAALGGLLSDEDQLDRHMLWRLGAWGFCAVAAVTAVVLSSQLPVNARRSQLAATDLAVKAQHVEQIVSHGQTEARRLSAAVETLNADRDRLFVRLSALEQSVDSVTGSIRKSAAPPAWPDPATIPALALPPFAIAAPASSPLPSVAALPSASLEADKPAQPALPPALAYDLPPPEKPALVGRPALAMIQSAPIPDAAPAATGALPDAVATKAGEDSIVASAEFGLDLGAAGSLDGLRLLWRATAKAHRTELRGLRPIVVVRERSGRGVQLHLVAGPIRDAATAARLCASVIDAEHTCQTAAFDAQRLSLTSENPPPRRRKPTQAKQLPAG